MELPGRLDGGQEGGAGAGAGQVRRGAGEGAGKAGREERAEGGEGGGRRQRWNAVRGGGAEGHGLEAGRRRGRGSCVPEPNEKALLSSESPPSQGVGIEMHGPGTKGMEVLRQTDVTRDAVRYAWSSVHLFSLPAWLHAAPLPPLALNLVCYPLGFHSSHHAPAPQPPAPQPPAPPLSPSLRYLLNSVLQLGPTFIKSEWGGLGRRSGGGSSMGGEEGKGQQGMTMV